MLGGFVWVLGDLFQQYATKYVGISRGIPLSNTNQLWGLLWGILVFHELRGGSHRLYVQVVAGSLLMVLGAIAIALSSATGREYSRWQAAAEREGRRYHIEDAYVRASMEGRELNGSAERRNFFDWLLVAGVMGVFIALAAMARMPRVDINLKWAAVIAAAMVMLLAGCAIALWRTTRFS